MITTDKVTEKTGNTYIISSKRYNKISSSHLNGKIVDIALWLSMRYLIFTEGLLPLSQ